MEGRALLASTPSAAAVRWHGRCRHHGGIALLLHHAAGKKRKMPGVRGQSPRLLGTAGLGSTEKPDEPEKCLTPFGSICTLRRFRGIVDAPHDYGARARGGLHHGRLPLEQRTTFSGALHLCQVAFDICRYRDVHVRVQRVLKPW